VIPATVIGGYLGAGKTTLINHALRHAAGLRLAVLVNEFGALAVDADLIEAREDNLISIAGGCICCAFGDNLAGALANLAARQPAPDHILIEASGVAIPGAILATLSLIAGIRPNGAVVLADCETVRRNAANRYLGDTILRQLADADLVVLTRTDLVDAATREAAAAWLAGVASRARILAAEHGALPPDVLLGPRDAGDRTDHRHHADAAFESAVFAVDAPVDARALAARLAEGDFGIIRAKGFVPDRERGTMLVQVVGKRSSVSPAAERESHALVCIGRAGDLKRQALARLIAGAG